MSEEVICIYWYPELKKQYADLINYCKNLIWYKINLNEKKRLYRKAKSFVY